MRDKGGPMKLIDEKGKIFGKVHIFDIIIAFVFVAIVLGALNKFSSSNIISFGGGSEAIKCEFWVETNEYAPEYFDTLKVGDLLAEEKKYIDGQIAEVEIVSFDVTEVDNNGDTVVGTHPFFQKARIKVTATLDYKKPLYSLGKQEIRVGAIMFLTTEKSKLSATVTDFNVVQ